MDPKVFSVVAVRGTGSIGARHLRVLASCGVSPVAMPVREGPARAELEPYRVAHTWEQALEAASGEGVRAAVIATDTGRHLRDAHAALSHGFHLLIEKPLSPSTEGVRALMQDALSRGLSVHVACNLRFAYGMTLVRERLAALGTLYSVRAECQSYLPAWRPGTDHRAGYAARVDEGGAMRDLVHEIDYALWLAGRPRAVYAQLGNTGELEIASEESADLLWRVEKSGERGPAVSLRLDYLARGTRRSLVVVGAKGELEWDLVAQRVRVRYTGEPWSELDARQERDAMMTDQARGFLTAAAGGACEELATLEQGAFAVALMDAARASSRTLRAETIEAVTWD